MKINLPSSDKMPIVYTRMNYNLSHLSQLVKDGWYAMYVHTSPNNFRDGEVLAFRHSLTILKKKPLKNRA